jgi:hypothetical protein
VEKSESFLSLAAAVEDADHATMKVLQTAISSEGYGAPIGNPMRLKLLDALVLHALQDQCELLVLPAGYLRARSEREVPLLVAHIASRSREVAIIGGIDTKYPAKRDLVRLVSSTALPYWGFAVTAAGAPKHWRQCSVCRVHVTSTNAVNVTSRLVNIAGHAALPLTCGEMYNRYTRAAIPNRTLQLVIDSGHRDLRRQLSRTLHNLWDKARCAVMLSQHVSGTSGHLHMVDSHGASQVAPIQGNILPGMPTGTPWVSAVTRTI